LRHLLLLHYFWKILGTQGKSCHDYWGPCHDFGHRLPI